MENNKFNEYLNSLREALPIGQSFDIGERNFIIRRQRSIFILCRTVFCNRRSLELMFQSLFRIDKHEMNQRRMWRSYQCTICLTPRQRRKMTRTKC
jgi:hypothetical protein